MTRIHDVIIIGAGPAGLFAANQLARRAANGSIVIISRRNSNNACSKPLQIMRSNSSPVSTEGLGGAGVYSDKLYFDAAGGWLEDEKKKYSDVFMAYVAEIFERFGGPSERDAFTVKRGFKPIPGISFKAYKKLVPMTFLQYKRFVLHFVRHLQSRVTFLTDSVSSISKIKDRLFEVKVQDNEMGLHRRLLSHQVLIATGRSSATWLQNQSKTLGLKYHESSPYFGIRVEARSEKLRSLTAFGLDPKIKLQSTEFSKSKTKLHCVCTDGQVISCLCDGMTLVDGTTFSVRSYNTSFNVLTSIPKTLDVNRCRMVVTKLLEENDGKPVIQMMKDFQKGISTNRLQLQSNSVKPTLSRVQLGEITHLLPSEVLSNIIEFLELLRPRFPGVNMNQNLVYAPVFEWFNPIVWVDKITRRTSVDGLFVAGDAAGISQGVVMAAASGIQTGLDMSQFV